MLTTERFLNLTVTLISVNNCSRLCQVLAGKKASLEGNNGSEGNNDGITGLVAFNFIAVRVGEQDYQFVGLQSELADLCWD